MMKCPGCDSRRTIRDGATMLCLSCCLTFKSDDRRGLDAVDTGAIIAAAVLALLVLIALVALTGCGTGEERAPAAMIDRLRAECKPVGMAYKHGALWRVWRCPGDDGRWLEPLPPPEPDPLALPGASPDRGA